MMNAFEVKNIQQLIVLVLLTIVLLLTLVGLPNLMLWISWNAVVGDVFHGPYVGFVQMLPLTFAFFALLYLVLKPEIRLEVHQAKSQEEAEKLKRKFESKNKTNDTL